MFRLPATRTTTEPIVLAKGMLNGIDPPRELTKGAPCLGVALGILAIALLLV